MEKFANEITNPLFQTLIINESSSTWKTLTKSHLTNPRPSTHVRSDASPVQSAQRNELSLPSRMVTPKVETFSSWRRRPNVRHLRFVTTTHGWRLRQTALFVSRRSGTMKSSDRKRPSTSGWSSLIKDTTVRLVRYLLLMLNVDDVTLEAINLKRFFKLFRSFLKALRKAFWKLCKSSSKALSIFYKKLYKQIFVRTLFEALQSLIENFKI